VQFGAAAAVTGLIAMSALSAAQANPGAAAINEAAGTVEEPAAAVEPVAAQPAVTVVADAELVFDRPVVSSKPAPAASPAPKAKVVAASAPAAPASSPAAPSQGLSAPLASMKVSSPFGLRVNPLTGSTGEWHTGIDLTGACSTPVFAAGSGTVVEAGWSQYGGGNRIVVDHGNGLKTTYNHLASIGVAVGQSVTKGAQIAGVGTTGASTGCHLHFEVMVNDKTVDPSSFI
jgi:murein DD-endopeptidase MepM/ murein hydrolase activator NlpD